MLSKTWLVLPFLFCCCRNATHTVEPAINNAVSKNATENPYRTIGDIPLPAGFHMPVVINNSFAYWLNHVALKKDKQVFLYDGSLKKNQSAQFAVLNVSVGKLNLQQCADAVMRLRADYLFAEKRFSEMAFKDNGGKTYQFTAPYTTDHYNNFLQQVFGMCGTASLSKSLQPVAMKNVEAGDVLIRGGFPGHAVIVMAIASNDFGRKAYLLAQSYMPAQDIHILVNPSDENLSPWYMVNDQDMIETPEYVFRPSEFKRWP